MTNPEPPSDDLMREQRLQHNLKLVVGGLGALILIGLGAVAIRVIGLATGLAGNGSSSLPAAAAWPARGVVQTFSRAPKPQSIRFSGKPAAVFSTTARRGQVSQFSMPKRAGTSWARS